MLNNKIAVRLMALTGTLLVFLALIGVAGMGGMAGTSAGLRSVYENNTVPLVHLGSVLDGLHHSRSLVISGMGADSAAAADVQFKEVASANRALLEHWDLYQAAAPARGEAEAFAAAWQAYADSGDQVMALARSGDYESASALMKGESAKKFDGAREVLLQLMVVEKDAARASFTAVDRTNGSVRVLVLSAIVLGLAVGAWQSWRTIRSITSPLGRMQATIGEVEKESDFSRRVPVEGGDEVGRTAQSFNELMEVLQRSFGIIQANVVKVSEAAHLLAADAHQVASSSVQESDDTSGMAATVEEVTVSVNHISESAREALRISQEEGKLSVRGEEIINGVTREMGQIAEVVGHTAQTIEALGQQSRQISNIVQVIKDVADQTNLLALNAAIEAARAGEQGRGFAVVADEVRKLAERTSQATGEITRMISGVQESAQAAVLAMDGAVSQVDSGVALAREANAAMEQIREGANQVVQVVNDISTALAEQSSATDNLAIHVEKIARIAERNSASAGASASAARELDAVAGAMRETVGRFKI